MMMHRRLPVDDAERLKYQDPVLILQNIGLKAGDTLIDLGCGEGYFAVPAARMVGQQGKVYALDRDSRSVEILAETARGEKLANMVLQAGMAEDYVLCQGCADFVFLGTVLHHFDDPARVLRNAAAMIKPDGKLINLDWQKKETPFGPPLAKRLDEDQAIGLITGAGFIIESLVASGPYHYLITARLKTGNR